MSELLASQKDYLPFSQQVCCQVLHPLTPPSPQMKQL
ncbi:hypothetical protein T12_3987 [Trichinella patagoniensis]|uniref:Uncharacterized protein n=1 Tax=Trichinella patagoniensis TaxID=990121 RepID=A0A0V0XED4_9BILA|nr:hypothetical protein T12_3987 [Trichinella patagoniensis]